MRIESLLPVRVPRGIVLAVIAAGTLATTIWNAPARATCDYLGHPYPLGRSTAFFRPPILERAKDFAAFNSGGVTHLFYTRVDRTLAGTSTEIDFGHAYSFDLLNWTQQSPVNPDGDWTTGGAPIHQTWDARHVWAPSIVQNGSTYYMFFTGVDVNDNQAIGVSTSTDLTHWTPFSSNPVLTTSMIPWASSATPRQLRDPFVMRDVVARDGSGTPGWLMYYSAVDAASSTPAVGVAWASSTNLFVWHDLTANNVSVSRLLTAGKTESPHAILHGTTWYLFYSDNPGITYRTSSDPVVAGNNPIALPSILGTGAPNGFPDTWFASEAVTMGSTDYLMYVHDFDPAGPCDPLWSQYPTICPATCDALEARTLNWNFAGTANMLPNVTVSSDISRWLERCVTSAPPARWGGTMVFDAPNSRMILFGGISTASNGGTPVTYYGDVWAYSTTSQSWTQLTPGGTAPAARYRHGAIYDPVRQRMLVVGGYGPSVADNRTVYALSLSGTPTWSIVSTGGTAPGTFSTMMMNAVYDSGNDQLVTVDINNGVRKLTLSNSTWGVVSQSVPELPYDGTVVYDSTHQRLLFIGGWDEYTGTGNPCPQNVANSPYVNSMSLTQQNPVWTQISYAPWPGRYQTTAYVDPVKGKLVIFGGIALAQGCTCVGPICISVTTNQEVAYNDAWSMDLNTLAWTQYNPPGGTQPPGRGHHMAAFDPAHYEFDVFGGGNYKYDASHANCLSNCTSIPIYTYRNDTWTFRPDPPPAQTTDLAVGATYRNGATVHWTAPGDDGTDGQAAVYDLRYYPGGPLDEGNWYLGFQIPTSSPQPAGSYELACTDQLDPFTYYWFMLKTQDHAGNWSLISNSPWGQTRRTGAMILCDGFRLHEVPGDRDDNVPVTVELAPARPNPSRTATEVSFGVPRSADGRSVNISVFDVAGRRTRTLFAGPGRPGRYSVHWDLADESGNAARSGLYFVRLAVDGGSKLTRTVQVVR